MRVAGYSLLCIVLVLVCIALAKMYLTSIPEDPAKHPILRLIGHLGLVGLSSVIGGAAASEIMGQIVKDRVSPESYIYPTLGALWGVTALLVVLKLTHPEAFSTGIVTMVLQAAGITLGFRLAKKLS
jgi:hypothetical protein